MRTAFTIVVSLSFAVLASTTPTPDYFARSPDGGVALVKIDGGYGVVFRDGGVVPVRVKWPCADAGSFMNKPCLRDSECREFEPDPEKGCSVCIAFKCAQPPPSSCIAD